MSNIHYWVCAWYKDEDNKFHWFAWLWITIWQDDIKWKKIVMLKKSEVPFLRDLILIDNLVIKTLIEWVDHDRAERLMKLIDLKSK